MPDKVLAIVEQLSQQNPFYDQEDLPDPPRPSETAIPRDRPSAEQIPFIQKQISILSYNHLPRTFFSLEKHRSLQSILFTAKEVLDEALPIRCLEATFVALHYTQTLHDIDRIPLSFKSEAKGNFYRHIVLVLRTRTAPILYGALGLSRKSTLMYKPLAYRSLFDVVMDYKHEYEVLGHDLLDIKLGIAITHNEHSRWDPCWRFIALRLDDYCDGANGRSLTRSAAYHRKSTSPGTLQSHTPKSTTRVANTSPFPSNGGQTAPPLLNQGASREETFTHRLNSDAPLEMSAKTLSGSHSEAVEHGSSVQLPPLSTVGSILPTEPISNVTPSLLRSLSTTDATAETYAPLAQLLSNYMRLLPTISEQYYKGIATLDNSNRALKLCFMDLDTTESDSGAENQRRLQLIGEMQSPLSVEAKRLAANRQLKPPKKDKGSAKNATSGSGGAKHRQAGNSGGKANKRTSLGLPPSVGAADGRKAVPPATLPHHRSPRMQPPSATSDLANPPAPLDTPPSAESGRGAPLSAALASVNHVCRTCMPFQQIVVDAQNTGSSTSPLCSGDGGTEGYMSPCDASLGASEDPFAAPPLTPRNYDARKSLSQYEASLRFTSSASDIFSTQSSMSAALVRSPHRSP
ncbi:Vasohibin [Leishmania braziliensis]|nr:Vasohibin [Leishmania braziliensis]